MDAFTDEASLDTILGGDAFSTPPCITESEAPARPPAVCSGRGRSRQRQAATAAATMRAARMAWRGGGKPTAHACSTSSRWRRSVRRRQSAGVSCARRSASYSAISLARHLGCQCLQPNVYAWTLSAISCSSISQHADPHHAAGLFTGQQGREMTVAGNRAFESCVRWQMRSPHVSALQRSQTLQTSALFMAHNG